MPLYDYRCRSCSKVTEVRHGFREAYEGTCPACGSDEMARVFNPAGILFKGSGFYLTDSRKQASDAKASSEKASSALAESKPSSDSSSPAAASSSDSGSSKKSDASAA
jgi:putative FmdB family regulatory protein